MKRFPLTPARRDRIPEEDGAPPQERASGVGPVETRSSGVFARSERPPSEGRPSEERPLPRSGATAAAPGPCRTFGDIYARYHHDVWRRIHGAGIADSDAKDVFQATFVAMYRWTLDHELGDDVAPLLFTMATHEIIDHRRGRDRRARRLDAEVDADAQPSSKPNPERLCEQLEAHRTVEAIVAQMPSEAGALFRQVEIDKVPQEELAKQLGRPAGTVRVQLLRARAVFKALTGRFSKPSERGSR
jgi:RNA polymerase sigma-70 factor (ECF subfamily)